MAVAAPARVENSPTSGHPKGRSAERVEVGADVRAGVADEDRTEPVVLLDAALRATRWPACRPDRGGRITGLI